MLLPRLIAGAIALAVLPGTGFVVFMYAAFRSEIAADIRELTDTATPVDAIVTEAMVAALPPPARRYLHYAGVVGQPIPRIVRLTQKGRIRGSNGDNWMTFEADETYATNPPGFVWRAYFPSPVMPVALGRDEYLDGKASILMKMLATWPVANEHGDELGPAGLMRYLNEMMWFPAALLGPNMRISLVDDTSFAVQITDRGTTVQAVLIVDGEGRVTNFRAPRYNTGTRSMEPWETPISSYGTFAGLRLPASGSAVWKLVSGDFDYIELQITDISYER